MNGATLEGHLKSYVVEGGSGRAEIAEIVRRLAAAALKLRQSIAEGGFAATTMANGHALNSDGDKQHGLDVHADDYFFAAARDAKVGHYASEERPSAITLDPQARYSLAIDPLDGSSNIDSNLSIGTIFSILPSLGDAEATFLQTGRNQVAAGFFIYGPRLALALTLQQGTHIFTFSPRLGTFVESDVAIVVPSRTDMFAINTSNYRHWDEAIRLYVDDCLQGAEGTRGQDFNMRWNASLVAETFRILKHGGVFLYPRDERKGYGRGRLRLVYEANPIAMLIEQADGAATDASSQILDIEPASLHQRTPLIFGSKEEIEVIGRYHLDPSAISARHPLFGRRGLFRA